MKNESHYSAQRRQLAEQIKLRVADWRHQVLIGGKWTEQKKKKSKKMNREMGP